MQALAWNTDWHPFECELSNNASPRILKKNIDWYPFKCKLVKHCKPSHETQVGIHLNEQMTQQAVRIVKVSKDFSPVTSTFTLTPLTLLIDPYWILPCLHWANVLQCGTPTLQSLWNVIKHFIAWYLALNAQINFLLSWLDSWCFFYKV